MKHTKEKWVAHQIEKTGEFAIFSLNTFIAQTENPMINEEPTKSEKQANARLIAAAPDLLRAIKPLVKRIKAEDSWAKDYNQIKFAEEAIDKAEGK